MNKKFTLFILLSFLVTTVMAQPTVLYSSINTTPRVALTDMGLFLQGRMQANQTGFQRWAFHVGSVGSPNYAQNWRIGSQPNVASYNNFLQAGYANGANFFAGGAGIDGELNGVVNGNYYTFNIMKIGAANSDMQILETNFNPTVITTVTQSPLASAVVANAPVAVTITLANAPAAGEFFYLRYSSNGYVSSSLVQANFTGTTATVNIPCQIAGTNLSYYVFSSNETLAGINSDLANFGVNAYDMATLNFNTNGGPNYSYTVATPPTSIISYSGTPYCSNGGTASVTNTGTAGGTYSSTAGLNINGTTGAINLGSSTAGTYAVTYTIAPNGSCSVYTSTTNVTVSQAPAATISYAGSPFCSTASSANATLVGTAGGTYSSTSGLSINAFTGAINIAGSTAGSYIVTYTIPAANGCALFTTTTPITITTAPAATISYGTSPYCSNAGSANVTSTGTLGGAYSSTTGLSLNASTGAVNLGTSTAGTYTVTYTIASNGGCPAFTTSAPITITAANNATINYAGSPFCPASGIATVTRTGTAGGTYSSTTGLVINATTGEVNTATSVAGTYIVTYSLAANTGCPAFSTSASITINSLSVAPISATASNTLVCGTSGVVNLSAIGGSLGSGGVYRWYSSSCGGTLIGSGAVLNNITVNATTTFFVRIEGTCNTTTCQSVTVNVAPQPVVVATISPATGITPNRPVTIFATVSPVDNYTYLWTKDNTQNLANTTDRITVLANDAGNYKVKVTAPSGCTATSQNVFTNSGSSATVFIFPNPSSGVFNVSYYNGGSITQPRTINVFDTKGTKVFSQTYNSAVNFSNMSVNLTGKGKGVYVVELLDKDGKQLATGTVRVL
jgi:hypothetical protein